MTTITTPHWDITSWIASSDYIHYTVELLSQELQLDENSKILDIGCSRGNIAYALAHTNHLKSPLEAIDISDAILEAPSTDKVTFHQIDAIRYLDQQPPNTYDAIIIKQVLHLFPEQDKQQLFQKMRQSLKKTGRAVVLLMPPTCPVPMFEKGKTTFSKESFSAHDVIQLAHQHGFTTHTTPFNFNVAMSKHAYFDLLSQRYMSNLRAFSDQEIQEGILELDAQYPHDPLEFVDQLDVIHLINH